MGGLILTLLCELYRIIDNKTLRLITERSGSPSKSEKVDNTLRGMSFFSITQLLQLTLIFLEGLSFGLFPVF